MKRLITNLLLIAGLISTTAFVSSCNKKKDTIAKIYVRYSSTNQPVQGCEVRLKGISTENRQPDVILDMVTETNAAGEAIFNFNKEYKKGQAGVAVLEIEAKKNGLSKKGIIKVEEETTSEETIFI